MTARPTSIRIFLADGTPDGIRFVDKSNWVGRALVASRAQLGQALQRGEMGRPGVYLLLGSSEGGAERLYVGEADVLRERMKQHASHKDFWTRFIAFTSTDESLNKAVVRYLEARLIALAKAANQWELDNGSVPAEPPLSEADRADAEWFLAEMLVIYALLGVDAFEAAATEEPASVGAELLYLSERGSEAIGREVADGFVVLSGSRARATETRGIGDYLRNLRRQLLERGVLVADGDHFVFAQDFRFASPSAAAGVVVGGSANGRTAWQDEHGVTLKKLQNARTEAGS
jgi:hypothetical protein